MNISIQEAAFTTAYCNRGVKRDPVGLLGSTVYKRENFPHAHHGAVAVDPASELANHIRHVTMVAQG